MFLILLLLHVVAAGESKLTAEQVQEVNALYAAGKEAEADALREQYRAALEPAAVPTPMAKLTNAQIDEARALYDAGKVEEGRALLQKYRDAPEPAVAPAPAVAPVKNVKKNYDCLGGICLSTKTSNVANRSVIMVDKQWLRVVTVCAGKVAEINLMTGWVPNLEFHWTDLPKETVLYTTDVAGELRVTTALLGAALTELRWEVTSTNSHGFTMMNAQKIGERTFTLVTVNGGAVLSLSTEHPDKTSLCKSTRLQGL